MAHISTKTFYPPNRILNSTIAQALPHSPPVGILILRMVPDTYGARGWGWGRMGALQPLTVPTACPTQLPLQEGAHRACQSSHQTVHFFITEFILKD